MEHVDESTLRNQLMDDGRRCVKCGSTHVRVIGQSVSPPVYYVTCADCGHSSAVPSEKSTPDSAGTPRVERMVRSIIVDFDLPVEVVTVSEAADGWEVVLQTRVHRLVRVHLTSTEPQAIRLAITRGLANA